MSDFTQKWVNLLVPFTRDYSTKLNATQIARETNLPQQTVSRHLNEIEKKNILSYVRQGKNKLFYFELEKSVSKIILEMVELKKSLDFQLNIKKESVIIDEILAQADSIIVFASYASQEQNKDSDLDILIINGNLKEIKKIKEKIPIEINEHFTTYKEFEKLIKKKNPLGIEIMKKHLIFGEASKVVEIFMRCQA